MNFIEINKDNEKSRCPLCGKDLEITRWSPYIICNECFENSELIKTLKNNNDRNPKEIFYIDNIPCNAILDEYNKLIVRVVNDENIIDNEINKYVIKLDNLRKKKENMIKNFR